MIALVIAAVAVVAYGVATGNWDPAIGTAIGFALGGVAFKGSKGR